MKKIEYITEPNLIVPLAASLNPRGIRGFQQSVTNEDDQLKINSIYEPITNPLTGKTTLYLGKRPGVTFDSADSYGNVTTIAYLYEVGSTPTSRIVFYTHDADIVASNGSVSTNVTTGVAPVFLPAFVDKTQVSNANFVVVQLLNTVFAQTAWFTSDASISTFTQITLPTNPRGKMEFLDGYAFIAVDDGRIFNSPLNSLTALNGATDWIRRRAMQDQSVGLARLGNQIISMGSASMEVYRNAGTPFGSPLEAVPTLFQNYGIAPLLWGQQHYYTVIEGRMYWRGSNPSGVFAYNGQTVEKVSSVAVDKLISERGYTFVSRISFSGQIALVIGLDFTLDGGTQRALLYFPAWKDWFLWSSTVFIPRASPRADSICIGTGANPNKLYTIATSTQTFNDNGTNYTFKHQFKLPKRGNGHERMDMFGLVGDTASTTQLVTVQFSDDDYQTSTAARTIDMSSGSKMITRCGGYRAPRAVTLTYTSSVGLRLESAVARIS